MDKVLRFCSFAAEKILQPFELRKQFRKFSLRFITTIFIVSVISISCHFINQAIDSAEKKDFWDDEIMGLEGIQKSSFIDLLIEGPPNQVSPAPLDFLFIKVWDQSKDSINSLGQSFNVYYRLHPMFVSCFSGLIVILILYFGMRRNTNNYLVLFIQIALLILALWDYYFRTYNFNYAIEMRAYALWNGLWFSIMALYMHYKKFNGLLIFLLILLAGTAVAAAFQLSCLIFSLLIIEILNKEKFRAFMITVFKAFTIPFIICLHYIFGKFPARGVEAAPNFDFYLFEFYQFWFSTRMIGIIALLGVSLSLWKGLRGHAIVFLTMLVLYLISPLTNYLTISRGMSFMLRYFRYYDLIYPLFFIGLALAIPHYLKMLTNYQVLTRKTLYKLAVISGLIIFISGNYILNYDTHVARSQKINRIMPASFDYLYELTRGRVELDQDKLRKYVRYYKEITEYYPNRADAYGMMGFCLYQLGNEDQAISSYEKAMELNPHFFWYHYNIAMIHLKADRFQQGIQSLTNALSTNSNHTLKYIQSSKMIYLPLIAKKIDNLGKLEYQLKIDQRNCVKLLSLSQNQPTLKQFSPAIKDKFYLKVF